jgi:hypothetical protein
MTGLAIIAAIVVVVAFLTVVYALIRVAWRLREGDTETVGCDSDVFRRTKR